MDKLTPGEATKPWPFMGYAPGNYTCQCVRCEQQFVGDKGAVACLDCAVIRAKEAAIEPPAADVAEMVDEMRLAERLVDLSHAKRDFQNELHRDITAGVEIGGAPKGFCRLYLYGPDSGIDSYTTRRELAMLYAVLHEVFGAALERAKPAAAGRDVGGEEAGFGASRNQETGHWHVYQMPGARPLCVVTEGVDSLLAVLRAALNPARPEEGSDHA